MQINYLDAVSSVLNMMKQPDSACKNIDMHRTCYTIVPLTNTLIPEK